MCCCAVNIALPLKINPAAATETTAVLHPDYIIKHRLSKIAKRK
jgi:hypothetical protein